MVAPMRSRLYDNFAGRTLHPRLGPLLGECLCTFCSQRLDGRFNWFELGIFVRVISEADIPFFFYPDDENFIVTIFTLESFNGVDAHIHMSEGLCFRCTSVG